MFEDIKFHLSFVLLSFKLFSHPKQADVNHIMAAHKMADWNDNEKMNFYFLNQISYSITH